MGISDWLWCSMRYSVCRADMQLMEQEACSAWRSNQGAGLSGHFFWTLAALIMIEHFDTGYHDHRSLVIRRNKCD
jgi:hypothetical protein